MKKVLFVLLFITGFAFSLFAQSFDVKNSSNDNQNLTITSKDTQVLEYFEEFYSELKQPKYQLYKTQNMWTFLKLDTETGRIWQVQYSLDGSQYRFETALDISSRLSTYDKPICGRFVLYSTDNMYNFILLDQFDGRCWQVQWSTKSSERGIWRIY